MSNKKQQRKVILCGIMLLLVLALAACGATGEEKAISANPQQPNNALSGNNVGDAPEPGGAPGASEPGAEAGAPAGGQMSAYPPPGGTNINPGAMITATNGITATMGGPTRTIGTGPYPAPGGSGPQAGQSGGRGPGGPGGGFSMEGVATVFGMTEMELLTEIQSGKSIAALAIEKGIDLEDVKQAILTASKTRIDEQVSSGQLTQAQADEMYTRLTENIDEMLNRVGMGPGPGGKGTPPPAQ